MKRVDHNKCKYILLCFKQPHLLAPQSKKWRERKREREKEREEMRRGRVNQKENNHNLKPNLISTKGYFTLITINDNKL